MGRDNSSARGAHEGKQIQGAITEILLIYSCLYRLSLPKTMGRDNLSARGAHEGKQRALRNVFEVGC